MAGFKRILVINRLDQYTRDAVRYGVALAKCFDAELSVLRVISNPVDLEAVNAPSLLFRDEYANHRSLREQYQDELEKNIRAEVGGAFPVAAMVSDHDSVAGIATVVREGRFDLLVILAHEQTRLEHMLFAENDALIRSLPCSILLMKHEPRAAG